MLTEHGSSRSAASAPDPLRRLQPDHAELRHRPLRLLEQGYRQLCSRCFNTEVAQLAGLQGFEDAKFEAVGLADCTGELHEFHFRTHLFGTGVALDAFELRDGSPAGYQFQIIGDPKDDLMVLLGRLIEKMRRALSCKHLTDDAHAPQIADPVGRQSPLGM